MIADGKARDASSWRTSVPLALLLVALALGATRLAPFVALGHHRQPAPSPRAPPPPPPPPPHAPPPARGHRWRAFRALLRRWLSRWFGRRICRQTDETAAATLAALEAAEALVGDVAGRAACRASNLVLAAYMRALQPLLRRAAAALPKVTTPGLCDQKRANGFGVRATYNVSDMSLYGLNTLADCAARLGYGPGPPDAATSPDCSAAAADSPDAYVEVTCHLLRLRTVSHVTAEWALDDGGPLAHLARSVAATSAGVGRALSRLPDAAVPPQPPPVAALRARFAVVTYSRDVTMTLRFRLPSLQDARWLLAASPAADTLLPPPASPRDATRRAAPPSAAAASRLPSELNRGEADAAAPWDVRTATATDEPDAAAAAAEEEAEAIEAVQASAAARESRGAVARRGGWVAAPWAQLRGTLVRALKPQPFGGALESLSVRIKEATIELEADGDGDGVDGDASHDGGRRAGRADCGALGCGGDDDDAAAAVAAEPRAARRGRAEAAAEGDAPPALWRLVSGAHRKRLTQLVEREFAHAMRDALAKLS